MQLVIGGAFQGKKDYVKKEFGLKEEEMTDGGTASYEEIFTCRCMYHFHEWIGARIREEKDLTGLEEELVKKNPDLILITNELGNGLVPVDAFDRKYRETSGRVCTRIAGVCTKVIRVLCGIGMVIKG